MRNDFFVSPAVRPFEIAIREIFTAFCKSFLPGLFVKRERIYNRAVHVPENGTAVICSFRVQIISPARSGFLWR
jgi:hypothetical protein